MVQQKNVNPDYEDIKAIQEFEDLTEEEAEKLLLQIEALSHLVYALYQEEKEMGKTNTH